MTQADILIFGVCCVAAAATQSVSSFGFGVVLVAFLPVFGFPIEPVVVLVTFLVIPNLLIATWRLRRHASLRRVGWVLAGVPVGLPAGIALLKCGPEWLLRGLLGGVLVLMALEPFARVQGGPAPEKRRWAFVTGVLSGALGGALSTGGPPIVIYFCRRRWTKELTKASIILTFCGTVGIRLVGYVVSDLLTARPLVTADRLITSAAFVPAVVAGTLVGERLFGAMSDSGFRRVVAAMLGLCGLYQIGRAVGWW